MPTAAAKRLNEPAAWTGAIHLGAEVSIFVGQGGHATRHSHPAHKILVGNIRYVADGAVQRCGTIAIPAGVAHEVLAPDPLFIAYLDARRYDFATAASLARTWQHANPVTVAVNALVDDLDRAPRSKIDSRALAAVEAFVAGDSLPTVAAKLRLTTSRLTHLVTERLGASPRTFRTWLKLHAAIDRLRQGSTATTAAHHAGFSDSAHFSRACRAVLGISPTELRHSSFEAMPG